ncbi:MAG: diguanylate cyclase [Planctomycetota bacterium]|jgi:diguanylate cyclase (GGDEF)-like protein
MPNPATLSFNPSGKPLFSSDEVRSLMQIEFDRARRYSYPVACLLIEVDRLADIQTMHGFDARLTILQALVELLQKETRAGDLLGTLIDDRLMVLIPHTMPAAARAISERVLKGAREMEFTMGEKRLRVSASVGIAHNQDEAATSIATLERVAEEGLSVAVAGGGDRVVQTELYQLYEREPAPASADGVEELLARAESMGYRQRLEGLVAEGTPLQDAASEVAEEVIQRAVQQERERWSRDLEMANARIESMSESLQGGGDRADLERELLQLNRRIAKLTRSLESTEEEIARLRAAGSQDEGVASVYREVQGLESGDTRSDLKRELMGEIFKANLDLQAKRSA